MILGWSFKEFNPMLNSGYHGNQRKILKIFLSKSTGQISIWSLGDPLPNLFKLFWLVEKHGRWGSWPFFLLLFCFCFYIVRETMHSLIVGRNGRVKKNEKMMGGSRKCNWYDFVHDELLWNILWCVICLFYFQTTLILLPNHANFKNISVF